MAYSTGFDAENVTVEIRVDINGNFDIRPGPKGVGVEREGSGEAPAIESTVLQSNGLWIEHYQRNPCYTRIYWTTSSGERRWKDVEVPCPA